MRRPLKLSTLAASQLRPIWQRDTVYRLLIVFATATIAFLALYNLTNYPQPWFDEGSHLHVPKTLIRHGVYADFSSEGFRHYGPTIGVGPTVMLPIALAFSLFGVGLAQARLTMVLYLAATIFVFYRLARHLGSQKFAWVAVILLLSSRGVALLEYGRQVLGEVPGLFFVIAGFWVWFTAWEKAGWQRLLLVGALLGLAVVTKYQYLLFLGPTLLAAWGINSLYYRTAPQRVFLIPGIVTALCFAMWQVVLILYLGPATAGENLAALRAAAGGAALALSPKLMSESLNLLQSRVIFLGSLTPVLAYGLFISLPRQRQNQQWGILLILSVTNLVWFVLASVGWLRYAFLGVAIASLFTARFFQDLTGQFSFNAPGLWQTLRAGKPLPPQQALAWAALIWLMVIIVAPLGKTTAQIVSADVSPAAAMASYLNKNIPAAALIETWDPEMGFLTDHDYHFPPSPLLSTAVNYAYLDGPPPAKFYNFMHPTPPEYVLIGEFSRWMQIYPAEALASHYDLVATEGDFELYALKGLPPDIRPQTPGAD